MVVDSDKLRRLIDQDWKKTDFAIAAGVSRNTLDTILKTGRINRQKHLDGIVHTLDISPDEILLDSVGGDTNTIEGDSNAQAVRSKRARLRVETISVSKHEIDLLKSEIKHLNDLLESEREKVAMFKKLLDK